VTEPHAVLGVDPDAPAAELAAAYRELAKRWHPDLGGGADAERRMAEINAAYDLLRSELWQQRRGDARASARRPARARAADAGPGTFVAQAPRPRAAGSWLAEAARRALGPELLVVLHPREDVRLVTPVSAWASPQALLAITDRRLLWLLDDAVTGRVRSLDLHAITGVEVRLSWPRRRTAVVRVARRNGRRPISFGDLRPETAHTIAGLARGEVPA
jgi:hypothetical protein